MAHIKMHYRTELPFVDEFRWVPLLHLVKNEWRNAVPLWCMLQVGPPSLHYCCAVVLRSSILLPPVGHSSNHEYHCCQLTGQSSCVSNFYHTFNVFIWLTYVYRLLQALTLMCRCNAVCGVPVFLVAGFTNLSLCQYIDIDKKSLDTRCWTWRLWCQMTFVPFCTALELHNFVSYCILLIDVRAFCIIT